MAHQARKRFGQHFLTDPSVLNHIVQSIHPKADEHLVEIGPGLGALTVPVLDYCKTMDVVELDRDVIPQLQKATEKIGALTIHQTDALKFDFTSLIKNAQPLRVIGNLPYNISTPLIFHLLEHAEDIQDMHFLLQKEVVERLCSTPGSKLYGRLGIMVQFICEAEYLFDVGPACFDPPPKVDSAVVRLTPRKEAKYPSVDVESLSQLVQQAFSQRRKTIRNTLKKLLSETQLIEAGIDPGQRPETITIEQYCALTRLL